MDVERPGARPPVAEIEEVALGGGRTVVAPGRPPGHRRGPGPATRAALLVGGLAVAIVAAGLLGPRPALAVGDEPASSSLPAPAPARPEAVVPSPTAAVPILRRSGAALADPHVLVAGRWMNLATGRPVAEAPDGCARQRIHVLAGGRIVCVTAEVTRTPGSRLALADLSVVTVGEARATPDASPPPDPPAAGAGPQSLASLVGRRDVVIGDPFAVAIAPGPGPDDLALAWAVVVDGGFEIGLEAFRLGEGGGPAERLGDWTVGRAPSAGPAAIDTLADLAVALDPGGGSALVGWTEAGSGVAGPVRRLVVVPLDGSADPVALPAAATRNPAPEEADGPLRTGTPCGGAFGEGYGAGGTAYVVCPGLPGELRVLDLGSGGSGAGAGRVLDRVALEPAGTHLGSAWLAGNGTVEDPAGGVSYRWSPAAGTLWRIEIDAAGRAGVTALGISPRRGYLDVDPAAGAAAPIGPRPVLALDAARGRLYALDAMVPGTADRAVVHVIDTARWQHLRSLPLADGATRAITLSPDGRLLYASTEPRRIGSFPDAVGVAVLDTLTGMEMVYAGRLRVGAGVPLEAVVVR